MYNVDTLVRVKRGSYSDMIHPLEMDASGILVPHVMNADEARQIARTTRFHPVGRRPVDGGNADGAYCAIPLAEYMRQANERRFVGIQIEDPEALDELDEIAAVEGIDMLFFGPGDFSQGIGVPGEVDHPAIAEARQRVLEAAQKHGKFAGTTSGSPEQFLERTRMGFQFVSLGADVVALVQYFGDLISGIGKREATGAGSIYQDSKND
jgi:4-hydroxy-2-oxoheptanedioate aldolase